MEEDIGGWRVGYPLMWSDYVCVYTDKREWWKVTPFECCHVKNTLL